jgi:hypothetical protein
MNEEFKSMWEEMVVVYFKALPWTSMETRKTKRQRTSEMKTTGFHNTNMSQPLQNDEPSSGITKVVSFLLLHKKLIFHSQVKINSIQV